jgi:DNA-binding protein Fis
LRYVFSSTDAKNITVEDLSHWQMNSTTASLNDQLYKIAGELLQVARQQGTYTVMNEYKRLVVPPLVKAALDYTKNNKSQAAELLGITRNTLNKMLRDYKDIIN